MIAEQIPYYLSHLFFVLSFFPTFFFAYHLKAIAKCMTKKREFHEMKKGAEKKEFEELLGIGFDCVISTNNDT